LVGPNSCFLDNVGTTSTGNNKTFKFVSSLNKTSIDNGAQDLCDALNQPHSNVYIGFQQSSLRDIEGLRSSCCCDHSYTECAVAFLYWLYIATKAKYKIKNLKKVILEDFSQ